MANCATWRLVSPSHGTSCWSSPLSIVRPATGRSFTSFPPEPRKNMSRQRTPINLRKGIKISEETRRLYEERDRSLDNDPDVPTLQPDRWANAMRREEFFRPVKKLTTVRIDADILDWLRSKGEGPLTRINEVLRTQMMA